jgi:transposase
MMKTPETPTTTESMWEQRALEAETKLADVLSEMEYLKEQIRVLQHKRFGSSSEKTKGITDQMRLFDSMFNEVEATAEPFAPEPDLITVPEHKRKKKIKRGSSLEGLPEETVEYHLPEEEMVCSCCGTTRHVINQEITKELVAVPAQLFVRAHVRNVYGCRSCEANGDGSQPVVVKAPKPNRAFPGSIASPSVVAHIIDEKYVMGVPLYRQEQQWLRRGVGLSRQNMSNWVQYAAQNWFQPIYDKMRETLLAESVIMADETSIQVLKEDGKAAESKSFMWVYRSGRYGPGIVLYEYQPSRAREHPKLFLQGFKGYLQSDGYAGYTGLPDVTNVGCWAHARRGFDEAIKAAGGKSKSPKALEGLDFCRQLYRIEKNLDDKTPEQRYEERLLRSKPVLQAFLAWLNTTKEESLPKTHLGKAITYCLNQWGPLNAFLLDGRLEIDNNRTERSIRPFVIARKNFLFCDTPGGAKSSAITFSIIESAKENGLKPYDYIEYLLEELPNASTKDLDKYMPWSDSIPEQCRSPKKK